MSSDLDHSPGKLGYHSCKVLKPCYSGSNWTGAITLVLTATNDTLIITAAYSQKKPMEKLLTDLVKANLYYIAAQWEAKGVRPLAGLLEEKREYDQDPEVQAAKRVKLTMQLAEERKENERLEDEVKAAGYTNLRDRLEKESDEKDKHKREAMTFFTPTTQVATPGILVAKILERDREDAMKVISNAPFPDYDYDSNPIPPYITSAPIPEHHSHFTYDPKESYPMCGINKRLWIGAISVVLTATNENLVIKACGWKKKDMEVDLQLKLTVNLRFIGHEWELHGMRSLVQMEKEREEVGRLQSERGRAENAEAETRRLKRERYQKVKQYQMLAGGTVALVMPTILRLLQELEMPSVRDASAKELRTSEEKGGLIDLSGDWIL